MLFLISNGVSLWSNPDHKDLGMGLVDVKGEFTIDPYLVLCLLGLWEVRTPTSCYFLQEPAKSNHVFTKDTTGKELLCLETWLHSSLSLVLHAGGKRQVLKKYLLRNTKGRRGRGGETGSGLIFYMGVSCSRLYFYFFHSVIDLFNAC